MIMEQRWPSFLKIEQLLSKSREQKGEDTVVSLSELVSNLPASVRQAYLNQVGD